MKHPDHLINILCYGDSNTFGYNSEIHHERIPKVNRWTYILNQLLGDNYDVIAEGLNGRTTAYDCDGSAYQNGLTTLKSILVSHIPLDYIIFMLGTNDCNANLNLRKEDIRDGMEKLIIEARSASLEKQEYIPKMIIVAPAHIQEDFSNSPFVDDLDMNSVSKSKALAPLYEAIAKKYDCLFYDAGDLEVSKIDGEHLTLNGHQMLAEALAKIIKKEGK